MRRAYGIAVCDSVRQRLIAAGVPPTRLLTHYIGVSVESFPYRARIAIVDKVARGQRLELIQVGRFVEKKGHVYTLSALSDFVKLYPDVRLTLVGDGPLLLDVKRFTRDLHLDDKVLFTGALAPYALKDLLYNSDAFLHHSVTGEDGDQEGIPIGIMEAMATGLPVISTFHSGIPELIDSGVNGFLVAERDVAGYRKALRKLLTCDSEIGRQASRRIAKRFDLSRQNALLCGVYEGLIGGRPLSDLA
jgi:glycosyltransferase involved in cell wall biosynthesis